MSNSSIPIDRSQRSVFVGNIPYETSEEQLKEIFTEVGPVLSFRLVYDRETGKPKGFGFCEYKDQETAYSAIRNLNNIEYNGRTLKVDSSVNDKNENRYNQPHSSNFQRTVYNPTPAPMNSQVFYDQPTNYNIPTQTEVDNMSKQINNAPEAITKAVASLPPEQMFEFMKQMKSCVKTNYYEARDMLIQNPQLAYALLQALIMMGIVDSEATFKFLHNDRNFAQSNTLNQFSNALPNTNQPDYFDPQVNDQYTNVPFNNVYAAIMTFNMPQTNPNAMVFPQPLNPPGFPIVENQTTNIIQPPSFLLQNMNNSLNKSTAQESTFVNSSSAFKDQDLRMDLSVSNDPRIKANKEVTNMFPTFGEGGDIDMRHLSKDTLKETFHLKRNEKVGGDVQVSATSDNKKIKGLDSNKGSPHGFHSTGPTTSVPPTDVGKNNMIKSEDEKSALIKQVLKLTDQQIALLPPDQQKNIQLLKQQILKKN